MSCAHFFGGGDFIKKLRLNHNVVKVISVHAQIYNNE